MKEVFLCVVSPRHRSLLSSLFLFPTDEALRLHSCVRTGDKTGPPGCRPLLDAQLSLFVMLINIFHPKIWAFKKNKIYVRYIISCSFAFWSVKTKSKRNLTFQKSNNCRLCACLFVAVEEFALKNANVRARLVSLICRRWKAPSCFPLLVCLKGQCLI